MKHHFSLFLVLSLLCLLVSTAMYDNNMVVFADEHSCEATIVLAFSHSSKKIIDVPKPNYPVVRDDILNCGYSVKKLFRFMNANLTKRHVATQVAKGRRIGEEDVEIDDLKIVDYIINSVEGKKGKRLTGPEADMEANYTSRFLEPFLKTVKRKGDSAQDSKQNFHNSFNFTTTETRKALYFLTVAQVENIFYCETIGPVRLTTSFPLELVVSYKTNQKCIMSSASSSRPADKKNADL